MIQKDILYFGKPCTLACDGQCAKAWGNSQRPHLTRTTQGDYQPLTRQQTSDPAFCPDADDYVFLPDDQLGTAPRNPGTYEGGQTKPTRPEERLNPWCARECERRVVVERGTIPVLPDFTHPRYNLAPASRAKPLINGISPDLRMQIEQWIDVQCYPPEEGEFKHKGRPLAALSVSLALTLGLTNGEAPLFVLQHDTDSADQQLLARVHKITIEHAGEQRAIYVHAEGGYEEALRTDAQLLICPETAGEWVLYGLWLAAICEERNRKINDEQPERTEREP